MVVYEWFCSCSWNRITTCIWVSLKNNFITDNHCGTVVPSVAHLCKTTSYFYKISKNIIFLWRTLIFHAKKEWYRISGTDIAVENQCSFLAFYCYIGNVEIKVSWYSCRNLCRGTSTLMLYDCSNSYMVLLLSVVIPCQGLFYSNVGYISMEFWSKN